MCTERQGSLSSNLRFEEKEGTCGGILLEMIMSCHAKKYFILIEQALLKKYDDYVRFPGSHRNSGEKWSAGGGG